MTDNDIKKALECCKTGNCDECPFYGRKEDCEVELPEEALDLINRLEAEIERLENEIEEANEADREAELQALKESKDNAKLFCEAINHAKSEAIKEFAEELKIRIKNAVFCCYDLRFKNHLQELLKIIVAKIDNLVKELTEQ